MCIEDLHPKVVTASATGTGSVFASILYNPWPTVDRSLTPTINIELIKMALQPSLSPLLVAGSPNAPHTLDIFGRFVCSPSFRVC